MPHTVGYDEFNFQIDNRRHGDGQVPDSRAKFTALKTLIRIPKVWAIIVSELPLTECNDITWNITYVSMGERVLHAIIRRPGSCSISCK
jgi:hypothetical protein